MQSNLISILMPVKNAGKYLNKTLQSIKNQSIKNWELIAVNDNSEDNSLEILKTFANESANIFCYNNEGNGIIDALKTAYKNSNGNYISRMDADDLMHPKKMELLLEKLKQNKSGTIATALIKYFTDEAEGIKDGYLKYENWLNQLSNNENNFSEIYKECVIPSPCWIIRKNDFENCGAFNSEIYPEDYDLCFRFYEQKLKIVAVKEALHFWRDYPNRTSRTDKNYADNRFLDLKLHYFIKLDFDKTKQLIIWGAGKKGKVIAKYCIEKDAKPIWVCDNENKIGKNIYGIDLQHFESIAHLKNVQIIIAVANPIVQKSIQTFIKGNLDSCEVFWFC